MEKSELKYSDITEKIIGSAMKVHTFLGNGFPEVFYQRALEIELTRTGIKFKREIETPVHYYDFKIGTRIVDFLVEGKILVELKAVSNLDNNHYAQIINYLKAYKLEVGLLINFGEKSLKFKRFIRTNQEKDTKRLESVESLNPINP